MHNFVGADAHIGPLGTTEFAAGYRVSAAPSTWGDVGIAPYGTDEKPLLPHLAGTAFSAEY